MENSFVYQQAGKKLSANTLKTIAIIAMIMDHIAYIFLPADSTLYICMRSIGRITGPVMFYFVAEGYHHTSNANRYTLRLGIFALISYVPFIYCFHEALPNATNFYNLNVIYTLFLGLLLIRMRHEMKQSFLKYLIMAILFLLCYFGDWYYLAPVIILLFDFYYGDFKKQAFAYCIVVFFQVATTVFYPLQQLMSGSALDWNRVTNNLYKFGMILPLILLAHYNGKKGASNKFSKWGFYVIYPLHLMILGLIHQYLV